MLSVEDAVLIKKFLEKISSEINKNYIEKIFNTFTKKRRDN